MLSALGIYTNLICFGFLALLLALELQQNRHRGSGRPLSPATHHPACGSAPGGSVRLSPDGRRVDSSFATRASPLDRLPFRLHRLLNLRSSAEADGRRRAPREFDASTAHAYGYLHGVQQKGRLSGRPFLYKLANGSIAAHRRNWLHQFGDEPLKDALVDLHALANDRALAEHWFAGFVRGLLALIE